jgi:hypothetical protein
MDRAALDQYIRDLAQVSGDLTIDDFREVAVQRALRADANVRALLYLVGAACMIAIVTLFAFPEIVGGNRFGWVVVWALSLGGLGGVAHVLLHVLRLAPQQQAQQRFEEMEVVGRIFLGCLFSIVLTLALFAGPLWAFADDVIRASQPADSGRAVAQLLFPFLCGYSVPLVLGLLDKFIQAVELTLALNDLRPKRRSRLRKPPSA